jgi:integrase
MTNISVRRRSAPLSDTTIRAAKPGPVARKLPDGGSGLYLLVAPTGGRLWRFNYRFQGKQKTASYGAYSDVPLALARERHAEVRRMLAVGLDPMDERKAGKTAQREAAANTFEKVARAWLDHWHPSVEENTYSYALRRLEADVFPTIGSVPVSNIPASAFRDMAQATAKRAPHVAERLLGTCNQIMRYAVAHDLAERNPLADIKPSDILPARQSENFARVDAKELPALLHAIDHYRGRERTRLAMQLMALVFVRTSELIEARWDEFDLDAARWVIPGARMKMRTPHTVPLSRQALDVLARLRELTGDSPLLFRNDRDHERPMSNNAILKALESMGYKGQMTGHGFRGVASTILHEQGWPHEHIEVQLAHQKRDAVSAAYDHAQYLPQRIKLMQHWADYLDGLRAGNVITLPRAA